MRVDFDRPLMESTLSESEAVRRSLAACVAALVSLFCPDDLERERNQRRRW